MRRQAKPPQRVEERGVVDSVITLYPVKEKKIDRQILSPVRVFHQAKQEEIGIICGMIFTKAHLHTPNSIFKQSQSFVDKEGIEFIESLKEGDGAVVSR